MTTAQRTARELLCFCLILFTVGPAAAQDAVDEDIQDENAGAGLPAIEPAPSTVRDSIVVTAQKREQSLQEVPISIHTLDGEAIERGRVHGIEDLVARTPSLEMNAFPHVQPRLWIRGIGSISRAAAGDPSVGVFFDEVYVSRPAGVAFDVFDLERIEVLRGPQGTLWGRNVVGGAIHLVTRKPGARPGGSLSATIGTFERLELAGAFDTRLGERVAMRWAGSMRRHDGYVDNTFTGSELFDEDTLSLRGHLQLTPTDRRRILLTVDATRDRPLGPARHIKALEEGNPARALWRVTSGDLTTVRSETDGFQKRDAGGLRLGIEDRVGGLALTSVTAYRGLDLHVLDDLDGGNPTTNPLNFLLEDVESASSLSQELRLAASSGRGPAWVAGLYYQRDDVERFNGLAVDSRQSGLPPGSFLLSDQFDQNNVTESYALFADATFTLSERWSLSTGLRTSHDAKDFSASTSGTANFVSDEFYSVTADDSWTEPTGRLALAWRASETTSLFATVTRGFKAGGFQETPPTAESTVVPFAPEEAISYELGVRTLTSGGRLRANATAFLLDYSDLQIRQVVELNIITLNAGKAEIRGLELEVSGRPHDRLDLGLSYAYLDAEFIELIEEGRDLSGNRLPRTPEHDLTLSAGLSVPLSDRAALLFDAHYRHVSELFGDNDNNLLEVRAARDEVDARAALAWGDYEIALWGKNLTDERFEVQQATFFGATFAIFSAPRTYGLTFRWTP